MYDEFQAEIKRLTEEVEYYQDRYEMVCQINNQQMETISTYAKIVKLQEAEMSKMKESKVLYEYLCDSCIFDYQQHPDKGGEANE